MSVNDWFGTIHNLGTCIEPQTWLSSVLDRIADHKINRIDELLPWNLHTAKLEAASTQKAA